MIAATESLEICPVAYRNFSDLTGMILSPKTLRQINCCEFAMSNNDRDSLERELANEDMAVAAAEASTERREKARKDKEREEEEQRKMDLIQASLDAATASKEKRKKT
ncbi:hypothetical protein EG329_001426 [Mollisiaceae sp. DMI_Dod_QoI]|nr:hypothetical protein EG329_001426 [Helotiales sp. DMI_Dod_QoI]